MERLPGNWRMRGNRLRLAPDVLFENDEHRIIRFGNSIYDFSKNGGGNHVINGGLLEVYRIHAQGANEGIVSGNGNGHHPTEPLPQTTIYQAP